MVRLRMHLHTSDPTSQSRESHRSLFIPLLPFHCLFVSSAIFHGHFHSVSFTGAGMVAMVVGARAEHSFSEVDGVAEFAIETGFIVARIQGNISYKVDMYMS